MVASVPSHGSLRQRLPPACPCSVAQVPPPATSSLPPPLPRTVPSACCGMTACGARCATTRQPTTRSWSSLRSRLIGVGTPPANDHLHVILQSADRGAQGGCAPAAVPSLHSLLRRRHLSPDPDGAPPRRRRDTWASRTAALLMYLRRPNPWS